MRAFKSVLDLTNERQIDVISLGLLVDQVEVQRGVKPPPVESPPENPGNETESEGEESDDIFEGLKPLGLPSIPEIEGPVKEEESQSNDDEFTSSRQKEWLEKEVGLLLGRVRSRESTLKIQRLFYELTS